MMLRQVHHTRPADQLSMASSPPASPLIILVSSSLPQASDCAAGPPLALTAGSTGELLLDAWCVSLLACPTSAACCSLQLWRPLSTLSPSLALPCPVLPPLLTSHTFLPASLPPSPLFRWRRLQSSGLADPALTFCATNAAYYKYFEYWSFGKALPLPHIMNSGRSLGDNRVDWHTVALVLKGSAAAAAGPRDVLLIPCDSEPPAEGLDLAALLAQARSAGQSAVLLQQPQEQGAQQGSAGAGSGPRVTATLAQQLQQSSSALQAVQSIALSTSAAAAAAGGGAAEPGRSAHVPLLLLLLAADVALLLSQEAAAAEVAGLGSAADSCSEVVVPVEAAAAVLAGRGRLGGLLLPPGASWRLGALDGRPHAVPAAAASAAVCSYAHGLPQLLAGRSAELGQPVRGVGFARVGLLGNPSDGYGGKTLSVPISNFRA
jgi:hypothetical protein